MLSKYGINLYAPAQIQKQAENRLFLQIKSGRILDILWAFLIKQLFFSHLLDSYEMIIANSYPTRNRKIIIVDLQTLGFSKCWN